MATLVAFLFGALAFGFAVCALFFAKFWTATRDRLFLYLSVAFTLFTIERAAALVDVATNEPPLWIFVLRLMGFLMIAAALIDKNRGRGSE